MRCSWVCSPLVPQSSSDSVGWCNITRFPAGALRKCVTASRPKGAPIGLQTQKLFSFPILLWQTFAHSSLLTPEDSGVAVFPPLQRYILNCIPLLKIPAICCPPKSKSQTRLENLNAVFESSFQRWDCAGNRVFEQIYHGIINRHGDNPPHKHNRYTSLSIQTLLKWDNPKAGIVVTVSHPIPMTFCGPIQDNSQCRTYQRSQQQLGYCAVFS